MKLRAVVLIWMIHAMILYAQDPGVENVRFAQRTDGSLLVDIYYDVSDADQDTLTVTVQASADSGLSWDLPCIHTSGDVGAGVIPGVGKHVIWDFYADNPRTSGDGFRVRVIADDQKIDTIPQEIISFEEMSTFQRNTVMKLRLNREGFTLRDYDVYFESIYEMDNERLIFCKMRDDVPIGNGDSGSPLLTEDGRVAGALCYGYTSNNTQFAARAIEDLLAVKDDGILAKSINAASQPQDDAVDLYSPLEPAYFISGFSQEFIGKHSADDVHHLFDRNDISNLLSGNMKAAKTMADTVLIPGMSIAILEYYGDLISSGVIGTASFLEDQNIFAFGHSYSDNPAIAPPAFVANMITFIAGNFSSQKVAVPTRKQIGALIRDRDEGILIQSDALQQMFRIQTIISVDEGEEQQYTHHSAKFYDEDTEQYAACIIATYPIYDALRYLYLNSATANCKLQGTMERTILDIPFTVTVGTNDNLTIDDKVHNYMRQVLNAQSDEHISDIKLTVHVLTDS